MNRLQAGYLLRDWRPVTQNFVFGDCFSDSYHRIVTLSDGQRRTIKLTPMNREGRPVVQLDDTGHISYMGLEGATTNGNPMVQLHEVPEELRGKLPKQGLQDNVPEITRCSTLRGDHLLAYPTEHCSMK